MPDEAVPDEVVPDALGIPAVPDDPAPDGPSADVPLVDSPDPLPDDPAPDVLLVDPGELPVDAPDGPPDPAGDLPSEQLHRMAMQQETLKANRIGVPRFTRYRNHSTSGRASSGVGSRY